MKNTRIELTIVARVYSGEDIDAQSGHRAPGRASDASEEMQVARVVPTGFGSALTAADVANDHAPSIAAAIMPMLTERLRHQLRAKGL